MMLKHYVNPIVFTPQKIMQAALQASGLTSLPVCGTSGNCIGSIATISFCADGISDASELVGLKYTLIYSNAPNEVCSDPDGKSLSDIVDAQSNSPNNCPSGISVTIQANVGDCSAGHPSGCTVNFSDPGNAGVTDANGQYIPCESFGAV
jgi:hypothetical protein